MYKEETEYYKICDNGYDLERLELSFDEIKDLLNYQGIFDSDVWIVLADDVETKTDAELGQEKNIIGRWENLDYGAMAEYVMITLYQDGTIGVHEHNDFFWRDYIEEKDGSISAYLIYGFFYDNTTAEWQQEEVNCNLSLILENSRDIMDAVVIYDAFDSQNMIAGSHIILTRTYDDSIDYSSVEFEVEGYRNK